MMTINCADTPHISSAEVLYSNQDTLSLAPEIMPCAGMTVSATYWVSPAMAQGNESNMM